MMISQVALLQTLLISRLNSPNLRTRRGRAKVYFMCDSTSLHFSTRTSRDGRAGVQPMSSYSSNPAPSHFHIILSLHHFFNGKNHVDGTKQKCIIIVIIFGSAQTRYRMLPGRLVVEVFIKFSADYKKKIQKSTDINNIRIS